MPIRLIRSGICLGCLVLAGCLPPPDLAGRSAFMPRPVKALRIAESDVVIAGPPGYCVEKRTARDGADGAFVMLGNCSVLEGGETRSDAAVLTALVSPPNDVPQRPDAAQLERFFRSAAGQAALAYDGQASSVTLLSIRAAGEVIYLQVRDRSADRPDDLDDVTWRAVFAVGDRLVALSAGHHRDIPVAADDLRRKLEAFVQAVLSANSDAMAESDT